MSKHRHRKAKINPKQRAEDYEKMQAANSELYFDLAVAIIKNVLEDYMNCLEEIHKDPKDRMPRSEKMMLEYWIKGSDFAMLSLDCIDPEAVIKRCRNTVKQRIYRERIAQAAERQHNEIRENTQDSKKTGV